MFGPSHAVYTCLIIIQVPTPQMKTTNFISPRFIILLTRLDIMDLFTIFELWSHDLCVTWQDTVTLNVFWTVAFWLLRFWILFWHDVTCWKQFRWLSGLSSFTSNLHFHDLWKLNSFYMWVVHESNDKGDPGLFGVHSLVGQRVQTSLHVGWGWGRGVLLLPPTGWNHWFQLHMLSNRWKVFYSSVWSLKVSSPW